MKVSKLQGAALDWAVAKCEGVNYGVVDGGLDCDCPDYSTDWAQGGPIIEREEISLEREQYSFEWCAYRPEYPEDRAFVDYGPTPLIAAMRCYVASKLGEEVEVPVGLV